MSSQIARKVVASLREPPPAIPREESLTEREAEVLGYLTKGYSGKEIAERMFVSLNTIKTHLKHIHAKLHVRSRAEILLRFRVQASPSYPPPQPRGAGGHGRNSSGQDEQRFEWIASSARMSASWATMGRINCSRVRFPIRSHTIFGGRP